MGDAYAPNLALRRSGRDQHHLGQQSRLPGYPGDRVGKAFPNSTVGLEYPSHWLVAAVTKQVRRHWFSLLLVAPSIPLGVFLAQMHWGPLFWIIGLQ